MDNVRMFKFSRGDKFSCTVLVKDGVIEGVIDEQYPKDANLVVVEAFLTEAETVVNKRLERTND